MSLLHSLALLGLPVLAAIGTREVSIRLVKSAKMSITRLEQIPLGMVIVATFALLLGFMPDITIYIYALALYVYAAVSLGMILALTRLQKEHRR